MKLPLALALVFAASSPAIAAPAPVVGVWTTPGGKALVEIRRCGTALCGHIARVLKVEPGRPTTDVNNPDQSLRNRPIAGLTILSTFVPAGESWAGKIYDPRSGRSYRSELKRVGNVLKVKGCYGPFCQTQEWTRSN